MIEITYGLIAGGALLGFLWLAGVVPALCGYRAWADTGWTTRSTARYCWTTAFLLGVLTYGLLVLGGWIAY